MIRQPFGHAHGAYPDHVWMGYTVLVARSGAGEALEIVAAYDGPIHLVASDVIMPGLTGRAKLWNSYRGNAQGYVCCLCRGIPMTKSCGAACSTAGWCTLQKPFTPAELARKVRETIDAAPQEDSSRND